MKVALLEPGFIRKWDNLNSISKFISLNQNYSIDVYMHTYDFTGFEHKETTDKNLIKDVDLDLNQLQLDIIEAFHNGWGCTSLSKDYDVDYD